MEKTQNVPTAQEAANIIEDFIKCGNNLSNAKTKKAAKEYLTTFFNPEFESDQLGYAFEKWWAKRKEGGIGDWFLNLDCFYRQRIIQIYFGVEYPKLEISDDLKRFCNGEFSEERLQAMERAGRVCAYGGAYPTEEIIVHKFCLWTLNKCAMQNPGYLGKKYDCIDWGWADWFLNATGEQKIEFAGQLIHYK